MSEHSLRRGWCPGALRPMETGDGLIMRIRPRRARLSPIETRQLARAARRYGNGLIDLTARANLQLRGLSEATHGALLADLAGSSLLDDSAAAEAVRNIVASPLAGQSEFGALLDITPLLIELEERLASDPRLYALPAKFSFLVDDGGWPSLADIGADLRFEARRVDAGVRFRIAADGASEDAEPLGQCAPQELAEAAVRLALAAIDDGPGGKPFAAKDASAFDLPCDESRPGLPIGRFKGAQGQALVGIGFSFGRLLADDLECLADAAEDLDCGSLRITPWRALLLPIGASKNIDAWLARFAERGFILDRNDARLAVAACPGAPACGNATTATQQDALRLAPLARQLAPHGIGLHVSGCSKGCALPRRAPVTLVGDSGLYRLARNATAQSPGGAPLTIDAAARALHALVSDFSP